MATATTPVTLAAFPVIFPDSLLPATAVIFASVTEPSAKSAVAIVASNILDEVMAPATMVGAVAVPAKSPAN